MKSIVISFTVAFAVALFGPHNISELGTQITRAGIVIVQFGMALDPPRAREDWYDAGEGDEPIPYLEQASFSETRP